MFAKVHGRLPRALQAVEAGDEQLINVVRMRSQLSELAHVEFFISGTDRWQTFAPLLGGLCGSSGVAALCGGRTPRLVETLARSCDREGCLINVSEAPDSPDQIQVAGSPEAVSRVARDQGFHMCRTSPPPCLQGWNRYRYRSGPPHQVLAQSTGLCGHLIFGPCDGLTDCCRTQRTNTSPGTVGGATTYALASTNSASLTDARRYSCGAFQSTRPPLLQRGRQGASSYRGESRCRKQWHALPPHAQGLRPQCTKADSSTTACPLSLPVC